MRNNRPDDEVDILFTAAGTESHAIEALSGALAQLKEARSAKAQLARLETPRLRQKLRRRSEALASGQP